MEMILEVFYEHSTISHSKASPGFVVKYLCRETVIVLSDPTRNQQLLSIFQQGWLSVKSAH